MHKKQAIGRSIRSTESFDSFIKRISLQLYKNSESFSDFYTRTTIDYHTTTIDSKDLQRLLLEIEMQELLILPYSHYGFAPAFAIYDVVGNALLEDDLEFLTRIHSNQFPPNFTYKDMKKYFSSKRNLELASLVNETITLKDSYYYY